VTPWQVRWCMQVLWTSYCYLTILVSSRLNSRTIGRVCITVQHQLATLHKLVSWRLWWDGASELVYFISLWHMQPCRARKQSFFFSTARFTSRTSRDHLLTQDGAASGDGRFNIIWLPYLIPPFMIASGEIMLNAVFFCFPFFLEGVLRGWTNGLMVYFTSVVY